LDENNWEKSTPKGRLDLLSEASHGTGQPKNLFGNGSNTTGNSTGSNDWFGITPGNPSTGFQISPTQPQVPSQPVKKEEFLDLLG
jgi:hypothetical protein